MDVRGRCMHSLPAHLCHLSSAQLVLYERPTGAIRAPNWCCTTSSLERPTSAVPVQEASLNVTRCGKERMQAASANKCTGRGERREERRGQEHAPTCTDLHRHAPTRTNMRSGEARASAIARERYVGAKESAEATGRIVAVEVCYTPRFCVRGSCPHVAT